MKIAYYSLSLAVLICLILVAGCNQSTSEVTGTITADGNSVGAGTILFQPVAEGVKPAAGSIDSSGNFKLLTSGGEPVEPGKYTARYVPPLAIEDEEGKVGPPSKWMGWEAPTETFTFEAGDNQITIELQKSK